MEVLKALKGKLVCVDTAPFIYFIENNRRYSKFLGEFFSRVDDGTFRIVTSSITLLEVLVLPYKNKRPELIEQYEAVLTGSIGVHLISIDAELAKEAAEIRARYNLRTPDAIQLAVAQHADAQFFLTNDRGFSKVKAPKVLILDDIVQK